MIRQISQFTKNSKTVSFGTVSRDFRNDIYGYSTANSTCMFREDMDWDVLTDSLIKDGKPKKIYCYACSDGSEPLSIALALISKLGFDKFKRDFSVIAKDADEKTLQMAKNGLVTLNRRDLKRISPYAKPSDYFEYQYYQPFQKGVFKIKKDLADCITFKTGDILTDADSLDYNNSVIFFRNVWLYLPEELQKKLVDIFSVKFTDSTKLVTGCLDAGSKVKEIPDKYKIPCVK